MSELQLQGDLTVSEAEVIRQQVFSAIKNADQNLTLIIAEDADYDFSLLQTLVSAFKTCHMFNVQLKLQEPLGDKIRQGLLCTGLLQPNELNLNAKRMGIIL
jgi:anti-anti-sigma regulatory factor